MEDRCKQCVHYTEPQDEYHWCHVCSMDHDCYKEKKTMTKMEEGKRYSFSIMIPSDGRIKSGLFTGEYDKNGNAILISKDGKTWSIPPENCIKRTR